MRKIPLQDKKDTTLLIIPAYNEEVMLGKVLQELKKNGIKNILVVNDGSTDKTQEIAKKNKVLVVTHKINQGVGAAICTGLEYSKKNYNSVVIADADGQHSTQDILKVLNFPETGTIVRGSRRFSWKNIPPQKIITRWGADIVTGLFALKYYKDSQCGLLKIPTQYIDSLNLNSYDYSIVSELLIKATQLQLPIVDLPIDYIKVDYAKLTKQQLSNIPGMLRRLSQI